MINLAAAAVLVRDLTEQRLDGAGASAPPAKPPSVAERTHPDRQSRAASARHHAPGLSSTNGARQRMPRSA